MKRLMRLIGAVLIALLPVRAYADLSQDEMLALAYQGIEAQLGHPKDALAPYSQGQWDNAPEYVFNFHLKDYDPEKTDGFLSVFVNSKTGDVTQIDTPHTYTLLEQLAITLPRLPKGEQHTVESMAAWKTRWQPYESDLKQTYNPKDRYEQMYIDLLAQDIRLPQQGDILPEEALAAAQNAITSLPDWSRQHLSMLHLYVQMLFDSKAYEKPVYQFIYQRVSGAQAAWVTKPDGDYEKHYIEPLFALFGGDNNSTPVYVSVCIDAKTGVATQPLVLYPGPDIGWVWSLIH